MNPRPLLLAVALVSLSACKQQAEPAAPTAIATPAPPAKPAAPPPLASKKIIADYMAAWNAHDAFQAGSFLADDGVYYDATMGAPQVGREEATDNVIKVFMRAVPDSKWVMRGEPVATADTIAFEWTFSGTNAGGWAYGVAATNQKMNLRGVTFVRIRNGKIAYLGNYYDGITMNKQLGW
jgi:steroid delta-isomerase-like uncharacterized protein